MLLKVRLYFHPQKSLASISLDFVVTNHSGVEFMNLSGRFQVCLNIK